ncbi:ash family protein [Yersinia aleksiciae]|uniref:ash family protein n=1 Tax=Yersinia aleksiciae TaxID=263819 RepID=UPI0011A002A6|nr:ash family protein [Yersinia aleksiciae]
MIYLRVGLNLTSKIWWRDSNPEQTKRRHTRASVFFIVASLTIPSMVAQAGQPSGWPVPF